MIQLTTVVKNLLIVNVLIFIACAAVPGIQPYLTGYYFLSPYFHFWQPVTSMFVHANIAHIFFNMYALAIFGPMLEVRFGPARFFVYYMVSGVGAFLIHQGINHVEIQNALQHISASDFRQIMTQGPELLSTEHNYANEYWAKINTGFHIGVLGASGAVFGILLAFGVLYAEVKLRLLFPPVALKARWFVLIYGGIELILALRNAPDDNVAHFAHLGGMIFGYIMIKIWQKQGKI
jgi:membrane associated rhomboid family serine protease